MAKNKGAYVKSYSRGGISRRDFLKYSSMAVSAAAFPNVIGCAGYKPRQDCQNQMAQSSSMGVVHDIFAPAGLGPIKTRNRIIRSATTLGLVAKDGRANSKLTEAYIELCEGGVGAIITGSSAVQQSGISTPYGLTLYTDDNIKDCKLLTERVHAYGTPIIMQITHGGRQTRRAYTGETPVAPSPIKDSYYNEETPKELTELEIRGIIDSFIAAIVRAQKAGFDGVQLHGAHGYLLSGFLSPATNRRTDQWGGSTENRFRIISEIYKGARKQVGAYPILIKINAYDHQSDGLRLEEAVQIAALLQEAGCDAIEVSCGMSCDGFSTIRVTSFPSESILAYSYQYKDSPYLLKKLFPLVAPLVVDQHEPLLNYNVCAAREIKQRVQIPIVVVGGIRYRHDIEQIIGGNMADFVALSRPFIAEPDIVNRFKNESLAESSCISCGYCLMAIEQGPTRCFHGELS